MTRHPQILRQILNKIRSVQGQKTLAVFDLDSTLFDVSPRLQKIIEDFANDPKFQKQFPESCEIMKTIKTLRNDWGIKDALIRAGLDGHHPDFHQSVRQFWRQHFFSNEYLDYDVPFAGAQEFVQELFTLGCEIVYLTGRDVLRMGTGTDQVLKKWKFPLDNVQAKAVLKPQQGLDDAQFKTDWFAQIPNQKYEKIWFFENEPLNVNLVRDSHNHVEIIFFDSTHSRQAQVPTDLPRIMHFLLD